MDSFKKIFDDAFDLHDDLASYDEIKARIDSGGTVKGTNLCILILAIFIASVGLNMNSTAVIIGAMLISPLMGEIQAIGYGLATSNFSRVRNSLIGLMFQVLICLLTSTVYFRLSPITKASSELLARTSPTIWDVIIATCGGAAGAIALTRKEKTSNVVPGVAIATALMPPLCTAGFGIAHGSLKYFGGAMYLFFLNSYFIALTMVIVLLVLRVPQDGMIDEKIKKRLMQRIIFTTIIAVIPSVIMATEVVYENKDDSALGAYTNGQINSFDVGKVSRELEIINPEIDDVQIGYLDRWDEETDKTEESLTVILSLNEELSPQKTKAIEKWIQIETDEEDIKVIENIN